MTRHLFFVSALGAILHAQSYTVSPVAGGGLPGLPAPALSVSIGSNQTIALDNSGNFYVGNNFLHVVYRIDSTGVMTVVAGNGLFGYSGDGGPATSAELNEPFGLVVDANGNLYIADAATATIREVNTAGIITTVAGDGVQGYSGVSGPATAAELNGPSAVAIDLGGNLYIADTGNNLIRMVSPAGNISTLAGNSTRGYSGDGGPATLAMLDNPSGVAVDSNGNVYIADTGNMRVRKVSPNGTIVTFAGNGSFGDTGDGGPATQAELNAESVSVSASGSVYVADSLNDVVRVISPAGIITTIAGNGNFGYSGDGGPALNAELNAPEAVATGPSGTFYIADANNFVIREISSSGTITTVAGNRSINYSGDNGPALTASLMVPGGVAQAGDGTVYIADTGNERVRKVSVSGVISTTAGNGVAGYSGDNGIGTSAELRQPAGLAMDSIGNLYVADYGNSVIRQISPSGYISNFAGSGYPGYGGDGGPATLAVLGGPQGVALDAAGNVYIADTYDSIIRKVSTDGIITTLAGFLAQGYSGDNGPAIDATLNQPEGIAVDSVGNIYIADTMNYVVRKINSSGTITTFAGTGQVGYAGDNGPATSALLGKPSGVAVDGAGNVYISDSVFSNIRMVSPKGIITTIAGDGVGYFAGPPPYLAIPQAIAMGSNGGVYIADTQNNSIRIAAACIQSLATTNYADSTAQTLNVPITAVASCNWSAEGLPSWITNATSGTGTGTLALTLASNTTGADRSAVISVNGLGLTVTQDFTVEQFVDVPPGTYYFDAVDLLKTTGVTTGCSATDYCPTQDVTRAEMAIFIVRGILGTGTFTYSPTPYFSDVQPTDFGFAWIQKMFELGITTGCAPNLYCPTQSVTRAEMAVFVIRARYGSGTFFDIPITVFFTDVPTGSFAFNYIERMKEDNITSGCTATTYCPNDPVTRGDMAIFMMRGAFNQLLPATEPVISSITPAVITNGTSATFTITGLLTNFVQGATLLNSVPGLVVNSLTVVNATTLSVNLTATATATPHPLSIYVSDPTEEAVLPNGLVVQ